MPSSSSSGFDQRQIPLPVRAAIYTHGPIRQFGWLIVVVGALVVLIVIPLTDLRFSAYDAHTTGTVMQVESASQSVNERPVYRVEIHMELDGPHTVHSFTTNPPQPGDEVRVNYDLQDPADACLELLGDDPREVVLYDRSSPAQATALDHLPGTLALRGNQVVARTSVSHLLILPTLAILSSVASCAWLLTR